MSASKDHHRDTEQKSQVINLIFFFVSPCFRGDSLLRIVINDTDFPERMAYKASGASRGRLIKYRAKRNACFLRRPKSPSRNAKRMRHPGA